MTTNSTKKYFGLAALVDGKWFVTEPDIEPVREEFFGLAIFAVTVSFTQQFVTPMEIIFVFKFTAAATLLHLNTTHKVRYKVLLIRKDLL